MISQQILQELKRSAPLIVCTRNLGVLGPVLQKATDPIQQLFLDKLKEYKSKAGSGYKLFEASPEIQKELNGELEKVAKQYGGDAGVDMTKFPSFKFTDPKIDPINLEKQ